MDTSTPVCAECRFKLYFAAACPGGHDYAFPCDQHGRVDLDALPERERTEYFFARALIGRDVARPVVVALQETPVEIVKKAA
jgi:hypothetical protein